MRYGVEHKEKSRGRILTAAARQFRSSGTEAVRVADVMQAAGLTHGGFYKHFEDKDQLLQEAIRTALLDVAGRIKTMTRGMGRNEALRAVIAFYLSEDHLSHPDVGCALAALGTEIARLPGGIKAEVAAALDDYAERLEYLMPGETKEEQRAAFLVLFPSMAGCLMTARALASRRQQRRVLAGGRAFFTKAFCEEIASDLLEGLT